MDITELGCPGHLIVADRCRWRRHTQIGTHYRVSTVGNYFPEKGGERDTIGGDADSFFETMVFRTIEGEEETEGCGCLPVEWGDLDCNRYPTAGLAQSGHEAMVAKYTAIATESEEA